MEMRRLGASGLKVSPLTLGVMMFGDRTEEAEAKRIVDSARDAGVNFIDTADAYAKGASESMTGKLIGKDRSRWVLATKVANPMSADPNDAGLSRRWLSMACDASLKRLGTDVIDLYWLHKEDLETPMEETVDALGRLIDAGKIRYFGVSNHRAWRIARMVELCRAMGVPQPVACQPPYNAMTRQIEVEVIPACAHYGIGVVPYSPLARGVLTGKYDPDAPPPADTRAGRNDRRIMQTEFRRESLVLARTLADHAKKKGVTPGQFAIAWTLNNAAVTSTIAGPRTLEQWTEYLGALDVKWTAEDEALVDSLVPVGHASTHGYNDPAYPLVGRFPKVAAKG
jgi:aryl-alcohol dehydrogenase-like predicted oxidoreductase